MAVNAVSFDIEAGETFRVSGPNGRQDHDVEMHCWVDAANVRQHFGRALIFSARAATPND